MSKNISNIVILVDKFYKYGGGEIWLEDLINNTNEEIKFKCIFSIQDIPDNLYQKYPIPVYKFSKDLAERESTNCDVLFFWGRVLDYPKYFNVPNKVLIAHSDYNTNWFLESSAQYADYSIACSSSVKNAINLKNCKVIWPGLDESRYLPCREKELKKIIGFKDDDFIVGQFCRFAKFKNLLFTIEALEELSQNTKLLLVGHGETLKETIDCCEKKLHGRFQYLYYCDTSNISNFYSILDLFCLPSLGEGYARVQWESMMFGVPFAGTCVGGVSDGVEDEKNGFIIKNKNDLAKIINKLKNKEYKNQIIENAKKYFEENGTIETNIIKMIKFLKSIRKEKTII